MSQQQRHADPERTFRALYEAVYPDLVRFAQRRAHPDCAEDLAAEALLVVWRRLEDLPRSHDDARAWVFGIARNLMLNDQRGEQRRRALGVHLADTRSLPSAMEADGVVSLIDLGRAWKLLSETHQEAIALAAFEGLDAPRAAAVLGISPVAFRLRLSRARRALRLFLDDLPRQAAPSTPVTERTAAS
ncbi:RNA polymerase sigma factor [Isoptericola sp. NPDC055881]